MTDDVIKSILAQNAELIRALTERGHAPPAAPMVASSSLTVRELAKRYWRAEGYSLDSASAAKSRTEVILGTYLPSLDSKVGDLLADVIDKVLLAEYRKVRKEKGKTRLGKAPTPATRNREVALVCRWFSWGHDEGAGCKRLQRVPKEKENNVKKGKIDTEELLDHLLECCDQVGSRGVMRALVLCLIDTGMRIEEVRELRWDGFNQQTGRISLLEEETKGDEARVPRLSPRALAAVMALPRLCDHVFASERYRRLYSERFVKQMFEDAVDLAGVKGPKGEKYTLHTLRHSFVYLMRAKYGIARDVIKKMGGWKTDSAFIRYGIVDAEEVDEAFDKRDAKIAEAMAARRPPQRALSESDNDEQSKSPAI